MGKQHNDSMSDQGNFHHAEVPLTGGVIKIPSGVTNVYLLHDGSSATLPITDIRARKREGRKLFFMVKHGQTITARFTETANEIIVSGSLIDLAALDSISFVCIKQSTGELVWSQTATLNIT